MNIDFIGIGAQRTGTSWVYACLYEHPDICAPVKEIHFFSRPRYAEGLAWYEAHFKRCGEGKKKGEFSTSYLYDEHTPARIHQSYPETKIVAILRNPIARAYSQYGNDIKAGTIPETCSFEEHYRTDKSVLEQGRYAEQLKRYEALFPHTHMLVLIHEDARKDPQAYIQSIYRFLEVDDTFVPSMLYDTINNTRVPKYIGVERGMHVCAEFLRKSGFDRLVHGVRRLGIPNVVRAINTKKEKKDAHPYDRAPLIAYFKDDVAELSRMLKRDLTREWGMMDI
ncbi:MAG TPA: sulfotransferase domain-containing protein [Candidatus Paceibacterota bacterium]|nr:sulfotransferase domain-containing protein [Candidatus Paceibacterota bacterium]